MRVHGLVTLLAVGSLAVSSLVACGPAPDTSTTWVYDEATTMKNTGAEQQAAAKRHLQGFGLTLVFDGKGHFAMTVAGGPSPGQYTGTAKTSFDGMKIKVETIDGKRAVGDAAVEMTLLQAAPGRLEYNVGGITAQLIRK